jgi:hypothetical protein
MPSCRTPSASNVLLKVGSISAYDTGTMTMGSLNVNDAITSSRTATSISGNNIIAKAPITFTTNRSVSVNEGSSSANYYLYDIDLTKYTKIILLGARKYKQLGIRVWEADGNFQAQEDICQTSFSIFMSDYNGLSFRSYSDFLYNLRPYIYSYSGKKYI